MDVVVEARESTCNLEFQGPVTLKQGDLWTHGTLPIATGACLTILAARCYHMARVDHPSATPSRVQQGVRTARGESLGSGLRHPRPSPGSFCYAAFAPGAIIRAPFLLVGRKELETKIGPLFRDSTANVESWRPRGSTGIMAPQQMTPAYLAQPYLMDLGLASSNINAALPVRSSSRFTDSSRLYHPPFPPSRWVTSSDHRPCLPRANPPSSTRFSLSLGRSKSVTREP
ncbi:hypothetical protein FZEAL_3461 [Fusarium zealandicum]|uniref:Uncharacterized protein n=1 Tax=Fusarium zealandicum TaxID=1053134 RepID=A0A8H4UP80_9HYPO|nr:hypothetical protein FZEAL_3461 [Fusarium zealandicum]